MSTCQLLARRPVAQLQIYFDFPAGALVNLVRVPCLILSVLPQFYCLLVMYPMLGCAPTPPRPSLPLHANLEAKSHSLPHPQVASKH
eukprot:3878169-Pleurochrysis_carterae.AAC.1